MAIKIDDGLEAFEYEFPNGRKETVYIAATDANLAPRFYDVQKKIEAKIKDVKEIELNADGTAKDADAVEEVREAVEFIKDCIDEAFDTDVSSKIFRHSSPLAIVKGGQYFFQVFMTATYKEIADRMNKATKEIMKQKKTHTDKYKK